MTLDQVLQKLITLQGERRRAEQQIRYWVKVAYDALNAPDRGDCGENEKDDWGDNV